MNSSWRLQSPADLKTLVLGLFAFCFSPSSAFSFPACEGMTIHGACVRSNDAGSLTAATGQFNQQ
jgi:hypothetical protein